MDLANLYNATREYLDFINSYITTVIYFREAVECYSQSMQHKERHKTVIQNTDLWIESRIEFVPELVKFRKHVRSEMDRVGVEPHPSYIYEPENNHYISSMYKMDKESLEKVKAFLISN